MKLDYGMPDLKRLEWDSDFFEMNVARIEGAVTSSADLDQIEKEMSTSDIRMAYLFQRNMLPKDLKIPNQLEIQQLGSQITYTKPVGSDANIDYQVSPGNWKQDSRTLTALSIQAGHFSRFRLDPNITTNKFRDLYEIWIENAIQTDLADQVYVYRVDQNAVGMISLKQKKDKAIIGLLAVDPVYRGMGIGKTLLNAGEWWAHEQGLHSLLLITQGENESACRFYESSDYSVDSRSYVYHFWSKH